MANSPTLAPAATTLNDFISRFEDRTAHIGVVGLGYVGLPLTLLFAEEKIRVTGFDIDQKKVDTLNSGRSYIHRIEPEHIQAAMDTGFSATSDFKRIADVDAVLICVPTPLHHDHSPDMSYVVSTIEAVSPHLHPGQLLVLESTTYPGTTEELIVPAIENHGNTVLREASKVKTLALDGVLVAFSPEREDPGNTTTARRDIPKVVGGINEAATAAACAMYGTIFRRTVPVSSPAVAEMTKLLENIYRSVNIALANQMKMTCLGMGIDPWEVIDAAATKPFGFHAFYPGPGVGGHCIPVDPFYLTWKARQFGLSTPFIEMAGQTNENMPTYIVGQIRKSVERDGTKFNGAKVLVLGVAYKRDVDDLRESPALTIIQLLRNAGVDLSYNDPFFPTVGTGRKYDLQMHSTPVSDLEKYDCVVILTDHSDYDYAAIVESAKLVIDTRNATRGLQSPKIVRC